MRLRRRPGRHAWSTHELCQQCIPRARGRDGPRQRPDRTRSGRDRLRRIGPPASEAARYLVDAIRSEHRRLVSAAGAALSEWGAAAEPAAAKPDAEPDADPAVEGDEPD